MKSFKVHSNLMSVALDNAESWKVFYCASALLDVVIGMILTQFLLLSFHSFIHPSMHSWSAMCPFGWSECWLLPNSGIQPKGTVRYDCPSVRRVVVQIRFHHKQTCDHASFTERLSKDCSRYSKGVTPSETILYSYYHSAMQKIIVYCCCVSAKAIIRITSSRSTAQLAEDEPLHYTNPTQDR